MHPVDFRTLRFILIASILYGVFHFAYHKVPDQVLSTKVYPAIIGKLAEKTINTITPDRNIRAINHSLISSKAKLNIVRGCDGSGVLFMLTAAIIGFGASLRKTVIGLALGITTVYAINQIRIVGLYYVIEYNRAWFPPLHTYYAPTLIILLVAAFFLFWTRWAVADDAAQKEEKPSAPKTPTKKPWATKLSTGKLAFICAKGLLIWFLLAQAGQQWGDRILAPVLPVYEDTITAIAKDYSANIDIVDSQKGKVVQLEATTLKAIPVTPVNSLRAGITIPVTVTLLHQLVPLVILLTILLVWPVQRWQQRAYMLLAAIPCILIVAVVTTPMQLLGTLEISLQNYAATMGYLRHEPRVLTWMLLTEGGARWLIPVLLGVAAATLVQRWTKQH